ncbi:MAG: hypothetical protein WC955_05065 [Elusimicrobiota bacterium]
MRKEGNILKTVKQVIDIVSLFMMSIAALIVSAFFVYFVWNVVVNLKDLADRTIFSGSWWR